jgi:hypothetical protein
MAQPLKPQLPRVAVWARVPAEFQSTVGSQQVPPRGSAAAWVQVSPPSVE